VIVNVQTLTEKLSKFAALHPQVVMYGISIGVTLGIALAVSFAMSPHDAFANVGSSAKGHNL
jgi:hypothetical protein